MLFHRKNKSHTTLYLFENSLGFIQVGHRDFIIFMFYWSIERLKDIAIDEVNQPEENEMNLFL